MYLRPQSYIMLLYISSKQCLIASIRVFPWLTVHGAWHVKCYASRWQTVLLGDAHLGFLQVVVILCGPIVEIVEPEISSLMLPLC